jgi:hypothetical protein
VAGIKEFPNLIYTVRWTGGALVSTVDRGWRGHWARRRLAGARRTGARAHQSSPVVAKGDEGDEAVPEGAHRSTSDGEEVARRWRSAVVEASRHVSARVEGRARKQGGEVW